MEADVWCVPSYASVWRSCFLCIFVVSTTTIIYCRLFIPSLHKFVLLKWSNDDAVWIIFLRYRKFFDLWFFYKEIRMRNFYVGLLLDHILFALLTFVIYCGDQPIETAFLPEISSLESRHRFLYFGWCNFWAEYSSDFLCCLWISS